MKIALVTTTINVPTVLKWYRACASSVKFFVVLDKKTPEEAGNFCAYDIGENACVYFDAQQKWKCSEPIGWNSIQRRNIGFLEALKWGADVIVSVDDDNIPLNSGYFEDYEHIFAQGFSGLLATPTEFFDIGQFLVPPSKQRGIPWSNPAGGLMSIIVDVKIGVAAGLCLGQPDVDAASRYTGSPDVHQVSELAKAGFVVAADRPTIWNSQNAAVIRELIPAWFMWPYAGRHDDIFASLLTHRIMRDRGLYTHYGLPMVWQQRNQHNLIKDMRAEIDGYDNVRKLAQVLNHTMLANKSTIDDCRLLWRTISTCEWVDPRTVKAACAFLDDCESVL